MRSPELETRPSDKLPSHTSTKRDVLWVPVDSLVFRAGQQVGGEVSAADWEDSSTPPAVRGAVETPQSKQKGEALPSACLSSRPCILPRTLPVRLARG